MKKTIKALLILTMLLSAIFVLAGCGNNKEDSKKEEAQKPANTIVGEWKYDMGDYTYHFNEDGTGYYDVGSNKMEFTYETEESKLSILFKGNTVPFETEYSINDNVLNVKDSFGNDTLYKRK